MESIEVLRGARELLTDPARWVHHGPLAVNAEGKPAGEPDDPEWGWVDDEGDSLAEDATAWCLVGACQRAAGEAIWFTDPLLQPLRDAINSPLPLGQWNDQPGRTHADVLTALDAAIASCS